MKKVIAAFAVLAIVGSALAFKPVGGQNLFIEGDIPGTCNVNTNVKYVVDATVIPVTIGRLGAAGACQQLHLRQND